MASYTVSLCLALPWCHPFSLHHNQGDLFKMQILSVTLLLEIIQWLPSLFWIKTKLLSMRTHLIAPTPISLASFQTISTLDSWLQPFCLLSHGPFSLLTVVFFFLYAILYPETHSSPSDPPTPNPNFLVYALLSYHLCPLISSPIKIATSRSIRVMICLLTL